MTPENTAALSVSKLTIEYSNRRRPQLSHRACDNLSLTVESGEIVGLVGESGSGKSSLAQAVMGFVAPPSGAIEVSGASFIGLSNRKRRRTRADIQMVFQDPASSLDPRQRIGDGFRELRRVHRQRTSWITDAEALEAVGLPPEMSTRYPHQLSGGQIQRVVLARALLLRPKLLLADEPTSALDVSVQAQILSLIKRLSKEHRIAVLLISHDLAVVRWVTTRVYVMFQGHIIESGETEQVLAEPSHPYTQRLVSAMPGNVFSPSTQNLGDGSSDIAFGGNDT